MKRMYEDLEIQLNFLETSDVITASANGFSTVEEGGQVDPFGID